ncbi:MAG: addiction module antidote protein, HigA family [Verrucomicrobia bacterium CG_4_10_14_3_um_filter_43_23]|nr:MAG: addiction module antidote protein, HigA family [Verrucomicrobia bacterium CG1_02_43_26]PIP58647.1 MAG: addiction module antidote protein, HigA family [Verrucomicrobia bacterium CG22_combo_CG10-13_8_21_14_all_43_17]PIX58403.1 MAG: addiction module antidote protein, HigA family [Verrucomicrobia bacterium CG_4_10_14_3_um_filter_43_23]PIY61241.1 MAG: addiction module antidote protein, HigA family [Verrucomicrobia bacterium CG_4_10_14_0_8_um_filter_43_34]PJA44944.1 MAG: addiction module anti
MKQEYIENVSPGDILREEFLKPLELTAESLAKEVGLSTATISRIINAKQPITADTALRFSKFFGNSAEFWMGLQNNYELREARMSRVIMNKVRKIAALQQRKNRKPVSLSKRSSRKPATSSVL